MICLTCDHVCHCKDTCQEDNGCGCNNCNHGEKMIKKLIKRIWNVICWPWKKLVEWLWTR